MSLISLIITLIAVGMLLWFFDAFRNRGGRKD